MGAQAADAHNDLRPRVVFLISNISAALGGGWGSRSSLPNFPCGSKGPRTYSELIIHIYIYICLLSLGSDLIYFVNPES